MLLGRYIKWTAAFYTTLLVSEQIPLINTIDAAPSEAFQLLSKVSEFASGVKDNIAEIINRPSNFFPENEHNQSQPVPVVSPPPLEPPPESPPEPPQSPETPPSVNSMSHFWRMEGSKLVLELELGWIPKFEVLRQAAGWVVNWFGILFSSTSGTDSAEQSYWVYVAVPAAISFFGGLGYGFGGWFRWCLSRRRPPKVVEKVEPAVVFEETERIAPASAFFESRLSQSYMIPLDFQNVPRPRRSRVSVPTLAIKPEHGEETGSTPNGVTKKEDNIDPLVVSPPLPDSFWYSPGSPVLQTPLHNNGLDLSSFDGFQPKPMASHPNDLPDTLLGSFPLITSLPRPPSPPKISDPWNNDTPDDRENRS